MEERLPLPVESSKITKDCFRWCRVIFTGSSLPGSQ